MTLPRSLRQPGPARSDRVESLCDGFREVEIRIGSGKTLLAGLHEAMVAAGACGGTAELAAGDFAALPYVIPARSPDAEHVAYFSAERRSPAGSRLMRAACTYGMGNGQPLVHCHAAWTEPDGLVRGGHILSENALVETPILGRAWALCTAGIQADHDSETNFRLLHPIPGPERPPASPRLIAARLRPNIDLFEGIGMVCRRHQVSNAVIRGGVGSLICPVFSDGRQIESIATEVLVTEGQVVGRGDGTTGVTLAAGIVDMTGEVHHGELEPGANPVCITFEVFLEELR